MSEINANGTGISTYHLADHPELYEPARSNAFQFELDPALDRLLAAGLDNNIAEDEDWITGARDVIRLSVDSASIPHFSIEPITIRRGNSQMHFAGTPTFNDGSLTVNDYVGARTKDVLMAWQALVYNVLDDVVNLADNYKFDCVLTEYNPDYSKVLRKWKLKGCWITSLEEAEFNHNSNDKRTITARFRYDRAIPEVIWD